MVGEDKNRLQRRVSQRFESWSADSPAREARRGARSGGDVRARRAAWLCAIQHNREFGASAERKRSYPVSSRCLLTRVGRWVGTEVVARSCVRTCERACERACVRVSDATVSRFLSAVRPPGVFANSCRVDLPTVVACGSLSKVQNDATRIICPATPFSAGHHHLCHLARTRCRRA